MNKVVSIILPTFSRPEKFLRQLLYLDRLRQSGHYDDFFADNEIIVGDGTNEYADSELEAKISGFIALFQEGDWFRYCRMKGVPFLERLYRLGSLTRGAFIVINGDEDFICPDFIVKHVGRHDLLGSSGGITLSGRLANVTSFTPWALKISFLERPYAGFNIDFPCAYSRIAAHLVVNSLGVSALAYSLQSRDLMLGFLELIRGMDGLIFHGGFELLHQVYSALNGKILFKDDILFLRDFCYLDYQRSSERAAPATDKYPYYGSYAIEQCSVLLSNSSGASLDSSREFIDSLLNCSESLLASKSKISTFVRDNAFSESLSKSIPVRFFEIVEYSWLHTSALCYSRASRLKALYRSFPVLRYLILDVIRKRLVLLVRSRL